MATDETQKPIDSSPEETKADVAAAVAPPPAAPSPTSEPSAATTPMPPEAAAAPSAPAADPVKQMGEAAKQAEASIDKALGSMDAQNRFILVVVLSIFIGGWLGSILNGQVMKGIAILVAAFACFMLGIITFGLGLPLLGLFHIAAAVDAIIIANRKTKGEQFAEWDFFWKPAPAA
ncbi:MAG: hypothetical protein ACYC96_14575 [Fimbriimonadaceae bacterium]